MKTLKTRKSLFLLADSKGYIRLAGRKNATLHISEDGTITRADTDLTLCKSMTVKEAYKCLNIR